MRGQVPLQNSAVDLRVLSAVALRSAMIELVAAFQADSGSKLSIDFDFNPAIAGRIEAGEAFDVAVINPHLIDKLGTLGLIDMSTKVSFGRSPLGLAIRRGSLAVDVSSVAALRRTLLDAKSIGYAPDGTSGKRVLRLLERMSITDAVRHKLKPMSAGNAGHAVGAGEVEVGIVPISTIIAAAPAAVVAGLLPAELDIQIEFAAAINSAIDRCGAAEKLLQFLAAPRIDALIATKGIERITSA